MRKKQSHVGLKQAYAMNGMSYDKRIDFIAIGLPLILEHSQKLFSDAQLLSSSPSSAAILVNGAKEEAAKILILMDIIRCPKKRIARDISKLNKWFYDHLARLIYAEISCMRPQDIPQLKDYSRIYRKTYYLDGYNGEFIAPNMALFEREARLYVDVARLDSHEPKWVSSLHDGFRPINNKPYPLMIAEDLDALGLITPKGLRLVAEIWNQVDFKGEERKPLPAQWSDEDIKRGVGSTETDRLMRELINRVEKESISKIDDIGRPANSLFRNWQFPMYDLDLSPIVVTQEELEDEQDNLLRQEMGDYEY